MSNNVEVMAPIASVMDQQNQQQLNNNPKGEKVKKLLKIPSLINK